MQKTELASPFPEEPVSQIEVDVPLEPIPVEGEVAEMAFALHPYERPLAASPFGTCPGLGRDTYYVFCSTAVVSQNTHLATWVRNNLGVRTFQGLGRNGPLWTQVLCRIKQISPCNGQPHQLHTKIWLSKCNFSTRNGLHENYVMGRKLILSECFYVCDVFEARGTRNCRNHPEKNSSEMFCVSKFERGGGTKYFPGIGGVQRSVPW